MHMRLKQLKFLLLTSMNLTILFIVIFLVNLIRWNVSSILNSIAICFLLYITTVNLKRTINILEGKDKNGK
jgi:hypothetical protein